MKKLIKRLIDILNKLLSFLETSTAKPQINETVVPVVQPTVEEPQPVIAPEKPEPEVAARPDKPEPKTPVKKLKITKIIRSNDGSGGFTNNPNSSRGTMKVIFPKEYTDHIVEVVAWNKSGTYLERLYNKQPNEWGDRERYYGRIKIAQVPKNITVAARLDTGEVIGVKIADPQSRVD